MRWKTQSLLAGAFTLAWAAPAYACGFWFNSTFLNIPMKPAIGVGFQSIRHYTVIAADAAFKAGDKVVIRPSLGQCHETFQGYSDTYAVYGAAIGYKVWNDDAGKVSVNVQAGGEFDSFDGGSESNIPIGAAIAYKASEKVDLFGGAGVNIYNASYDDGDSYSSNDLGIFAGVAFHTGAFVIDGGVTNFNYEGGSETALNVGASMELGGMSNALRAIGSLFRNR